MKAKTVYMIRDRFTGKFSPGGTDALRQYQLGRWKETGKIWNGIGPLKNHLRQFVDTTWKAGQRIENNVIPWNWQVVPIEVVYHPQDAMVARDLIPPQKNVNMELPL